MISPEQVQRALDGGVAKGAFPGAVCLWGKPEEEPQPALAGNLGRSRDIRPVTPSAIYDLASLSKIMVSTSLIMILEERGLFDIHQPLSLGPLGKAVQWPPPWREITPAHLLAHQSGLAPWLPLYRLADKSAAPDVKRWAALTAITQSRPEAEPGHKTIYSDLNFILLGFLLEEISGQSLPALFQEEIAGPLKLTSATFKPTSGDIAPTEDGFRLGGPPGHPQAQWRGPVPPGRAHDDNAAWLGGAAGHAGLFSAAGDIWAIVRDWSRALRGRGLIFGPNIHDFIKPQPLFDGEAGAAPQPLRALGFDLKSPDGTVFPPSAVGHLAYTGPSLWWDWERDFACLILCNRVHPTARRGGIADFRQNLMRAPA